MLRAVIVTLHTIRIVVQERIGAVHLQHRYPLMALAAFKQKDAKGQSAARTMRSSSRPANLETGRCDQVFVVAQFNLIARLISDQQLNFLFQLSGSFRHILDIGQ